MSPRRQLDASLAEEKRRIPELVDGLEKQMGEMRRRHEKEFKALHDEWIRALRAKPGSKYDIRTRKGKK